MSAVSINPRLILAAVSRTLVFSWVISMFWLWFVAPFGLPEIGLFQFFGLNLTLGHFGFRFNTRAQPSKVSDISDYLTVEMVEMGVALALGYLAHLGMGL